MKPRLSVVLPVYTPLPLQRAMTEFVIKTMRANADDDYELIVAEAVGEHWRPEKWAHDPLMRVDQYSRYAERTGNMSIEVNTAFGLARADIMAQTANDIVMPKGWDTALLEPFKRFKDCGVASLAGLEPGAAPIGALMPKIVEGFYAPLMAFAKRWRIDESYPGGWYSDNDMIMRVYREGLRAYRNHAAQIIHLNHMTNALVDQGQHAKDHALAEKMFHDKWGDSPLLIYGMIRAGGILWGREHESLLRAIRPHPGSHL